MRARASGHPTTEGVAIKNLLYLTRSNPHHPDGFTQARDRGFVAELLRLPLEVIGAVTDAPFGGPEVFFDLVTARAQGDRDRFGGLRQRALNCYEQAARGWALYPEDREGPESLQLDLAMRECAGVPEEELERVRSEAVSRAYSEGSYRSPSPFTMEGFSPGTSSVRFSEESSTPVAELFLEDGGWVCRSPELPGATIALGDAGELESVELHRDDYGFLHLVATFSDAGGTCGVRVSLTRAAPCVRFNQVPADEALERNSIYRHLRSSIEASRRRLDALCAKIEELRTQHPELALLAPEEFDRLVTEAAGGRWPRVVQDARSLVYDLTHWEGQGSLRELARRPRTSGVAELDATVRARRGVLESRHDQLRASEATEDLRGAIASFEHGVEQLLAGFEAHANASSTDYTVFPLIGKYQLEDPASRSWLATHDQPGLIDSLRGLLAEVDERVPQDRPPPTPRWPEARVEVVSAGIV